MRILRNIFAVLALLALTWTTTDAQEITDTITIEITGTLTGVVLTAEYLTPLQVGDTAILRAVVHDEDGDPISALVTFYTEDATALALEAITDPETPTNEGLARGIALRKATVRVWVMVEPVSHMYLASFRGGVLRWTGHDTIPVGGELQYCAYLVRGGYLVAESPGPPTCPMVFQPAPLPEPYTFLSRVDRRLDRQVLNRLARALPSRTGTD